MDKSKFSGHYVPMFMKRQGFMVRIYQEIQAQSVY